MWSLTQLWQQPAPDGADVWSVALSGAVSCGSWRLAPALAPVRGSVWGWVTVVADACGGRAVVLCTVSTPASDSHRRRSRISVYTMYLLSYIIILELSRHLLRIAYGRTVSGRPVVCTSYHMCPHLDLRVSVEYSRHGIQVTTLSALISAKRYNKYTHTIDIGVAQQSAPR